MGWTDPKTVRFNDKLDAALWNEQIRDNEIFLANKPMAVYRSTTNTPLANTLTYIPGGSPVFDNASIGNWIGTSKAIDFPLNGIWYASTYMLIQKTTGPLQNGLMELRIAGTGATPDVRSYYKSPNSSEDTVSFRCSAVFPVSNTTTTFFCRVGGTGNCISLMRYFTLQWLAPLP